MSLRQPAGPRLRLLSWNVHAAVGTDGRRSIDRIAEVIAAVAPDIACLQELDVARRRSGFIDQPSALAVRLGMEPLFGAAIRDGDASYGNVILSRLPLLDPQVIALPGMRFSEPRTAVAATVRTDFGRVRVVTCHLSLWLPDRRRQAPVLARAIDPEIPTIVAGDFNELPGWATIDRLVRSGLVRAESRATFPSQRPLLALDHVLVDQRLALELEGGQTSCSASDHLPVVVSVRARAEAPHAGQRSSVDGRRGGGPSVGTSTDA